MSGFIRWNCFCLQCEKGFDHDNKFYKMFKTRSWRFYFESCFPYYYFGSKLNISENVLAGNRTFPQFRCDDSKHLLKDSSRLKPFPSLPNGMNTDNVHSSQMDASRASSESGSYGWLINRLCKKGLHVLDVGGASDCFFRAISHQFYGTLKFHIAERQAGVRFLEQYSDWLVESVFQHPQPLMKFNLNLKNSKCSDLLQNTDKKLLCKSLNLLINFIFTCNAKLNHATEIIHTTSLQN